MCDHINCPVGALSDGMLHNPVSKSRVYFSWRGENERIRLLEDTGEEGFQLNLEPFFFFSVANHVLEREGAFTECDCVSERDGTPVHEEVFAIDGTDLVSLGASNEEEAGSAFSPV